MIIMSIGNNDDDKSITFDDDYDANDDDKSMTFEWSLLNCRSVRHISQQLPISKYNSRSCQRHRNHRQDHRHNHEKASKLL